MHWCCTLDFVVCFLVLFVRCIDHVDAFLVLLPVMTIKLAVVGIYLFFPVFGGIISVISFTDILEDIIF